MSSSNASATLFGWDFQINAAIVLMLENIEIAEQVRVEGSTEDIEIKLNNGKILYSQAKSVVKCTDYSNVKEKLKKALTTLSVASKDPNCDRLIYVTNSPNPFGDKDSMTAFYGHTRRAFKDLPDSQPCRARPALHH
jgi:pectate lyase